MIIVSHTMLSVSYTNIKIAKVTVKKVYFEILIHYYMRDDYKSPSVKTKKRGEEDVLLSLFSSRSR